MRYHLLLLSLVLSLIPSISVQAAPPGVTIEVTPITQPLTYGSDFNVLIYDFSMETTVGEVIDTLTLTSSGTGRAGIEVAKLTLWEDHGDEGFQGWGYDTQLGESTNGSPWVFDSIDFTFTESKHRFFVSLESGTFIQDKTFQVVLSQPQDINEDGVYQPNDTGLFFESGLVEDIPLTASTTVFFKDTKLDQEAPRAFVNELVFGERNDFIDPEFPLVFTGQARDRGFGFTDEVLVTIGNETFEATDTGLAFSTWRLEYTPTQDIVDGALSLKPMDGDGRDWIGPDYDIYIDTRKPSEDLTIFSVTEQGSSLLIETTLRDSVAKTLPYRDIIIRSSVQGGEVREIEGKTDENGEYAVLIPVDGIDSQTVEILYRDEVLRDQVIALTSEPTPEPPVIAPPSSQIQPGDLIKASLDAVYYYSANGTRHVFVTQRIFDSWYDGDFSGVKTITDEELAAIPLGAAVGYRPGSLVTAPSINEVYVVDRGQFLRHLGSEQVALELFGQNWNTSVNDIQESLLFNYNFGAIINTPSDIDLPTIMSQPITIDDELTLS